MKKEIETKINMLSEGIKEFVRKGREQLFEVNQRSKD